MKQRIPMTPENMIDVSAKRYHVGRINILILAAFTLINIVMLAAGNYTYFLFSAAVPYLLVDYGMFFTGRYPQEAYEALDSAFEFYNDSFFYIALAISFIIILFYVVCFLLSKRHIGWLIAAFAAFILDTAMMFLFYDLASSIVDIIFHVYVIVYFALAIAGYFKLKTLLAERAAQDALTVSVETAEDEGADGTEQ